MNMKSILGAVSIGKDMSGNFKPSFKGLAVRATSDGRFVVKEGDQLLDVGDLTLDGADSYVYRLPVQSVKPGDVVVTSDSPFNALFVQEALSNGNLRGLDPGTSKVVEYVPFTNLFNVRFFVKVVSLLDGLGGDFGANNLLPLLVLSSKGDNGKSDDSITSLLLLQAFSGKGADSKNLLPLLLLKGGKGDGLETLLLLQALAGGKDPFGNLFGSEAEIPAESTRGDKPTAYPTSSSKT